MCSEVFERVVFEEEHDIATAEDVDAVIPHSLKAYEGAIASIVRFMRLTCYEILLCWSKEDQAFIAEVPELPGCAADGDTCQEALQNVEVIMQEWIERAKELGRPIPEPKGRLMFA